jgi:hypothetical protein|tara:strand:- start:177 stop:395 length:219 start_codon:yes stop_codon:yes gene_type:complete
MQSHYVAGRNPGAYSQIDGQTSLDDSSPQPMQTGIASMMTTHGNGGFSDFMQADQTGRSISSSDEDLFSVSL